MKCHIVCLGVIDKSNKQHSVSFSEGLNVITGASKTGKSAMIDIFDFCMGSSEFTVPAGVIRNTAATYFLVLSIEESYLVLARSSETKKHALKTHTSLPDITKFSNESLVCDVSQKDFKEDLSRRFGLDISDLDEDLSIKEYRFQNKKGARASIRHGVSFLLQHQNLIANKHSIFYRFNQAEKREATIQQFNVFAGFVTAEYLSKSQKLNDVERQLVQLERLELKKSEQQEVRGLQLDSLMRQYKITTGNKLLSVSANTILLNPRDYLEQIKRIEIEIQEDSDTLLKQAHQLEKHKTQLERNIYLLNLKLHDVTSSISYIENYKNDIKALNTPPRALIHDSSCPFCKTKNNSILIEENRLVESINWLNDQLHKVPTLMDSFYPEQSATEKEIKQFREQLKNVNAQIQEIKEKQRELHGYRDLLTLGLKEKLRVEIFLETEIGQRATNSNIEELKIKISQLKSELKKFGLEEKRNEAERYINEQMNNIGSHFEFEETYKPLNLKFDLNTFDLYHTVNNEKIYLHSMGSGANWLYSHLSLFLALLRFFCSIGKQSAIPSLLFLDQPSQVYFPESIQDNGVKFDPEAIKKSQGKEDELTEDLRAVTNLFTQLAKFCDETEMMTGIKPQIIVLEHADNLQLDGYSFESFVQGRRWRGPKKFIDTTEGHNL